MIRLVDLYQAGLRRGGLEFLYELMKEREPEISISHRELPSFEQHRQFVTRRPYRFWYLIEFVADTPEQAVASGGYIAPVWVGYVSATHDNAVGIVLLKVFRGRGFGPLAVEALMKLHRPNPAEPSVRNGQWLANIAPANERSRRAFECIGFRKIQETFEFQKSNEETHGNEEKAG